MKHPDTRNLGQRTTQYASPNVLRDRPNAIWNKKQRSADLSSLSLTPSLQSRRLLLNVSHAVPQGRDVINLAGQEVGILLLQVTHPVGIGEVKAAMIEGGRQSVGIIK